MNIPLHIGIDDTDSIKAGCTTYIAAVLVEKLSRVAHVIGAAIPCRANLLISIVNVCLQLVIK